MRRIFNRAYGRSAVRDCLMRGEAPIAGHLLYTQPGVLRDREPSERVWGMLAGQSWFKQADALVVYEDYGISEGMEKDIALYLSHQCYIEYRKLYQTTPNAWADGLLGA